MQILTENLGAFSSTAKAVGVALVTEDVAASTGSVKFAAEVDQFWGFHVVSDEEIFPNMTVHSVPTRSLSQIRVRRSSLVPFCVLYCVLQPLVCFELRSPFPGNIERQVSPMLAISIALALKAHALVVSALKMRSLVHYWLAPRPLPGKQ
jgi:hypothetical protein